MERPKGLLQHYNWDILYTDDEYTDDEDLSYFLVPTGLQHQLLNQIDQMVEVIEYYARDPHTEEGIECDASPVVAQLFLEKYKEWK